MNLNFLLSGLGPDFYQTVTELSLRGEKKHLIKSVARFLIHAGQQRVFGETDDTFGEN